MGSQQSAAAGEAEHQQSSMFADLETYSWFLGEKENWVFGDSHAQTVSKSTRTESALSPDSTTMITFDVPSKGHSQGASVAGSWQARRQKWQSASEQLQNDPRMYNNGSANYALYAGSSSQNFRNGSKTSKKAIDKAALEASMRVHMYFEGKQDPYEGGSFKSRSPSQLMDSSRSSTGSSAEKRSRDSQAEMSQHFSQSLKMLSQANTEHSIHVEEKKLNVAKHRMRRMSDSRFLSNQCSGKIAASVRDLHPMGKVVVTPICSHSSGDLTALENTPKARRNDPRAYSLSE